MLKKKLLYLDHNTAIDVLKGRRLGLVAAVQQFKERGGRVIYSPAHMEEVANIYRSDADDFDCEIHVQEHLKFFAQLTDCWEFLPCDSGPVILKQEHPAVCFKRVIDQYELTYHAEGFEAVLRELNPLTASPSPSVDAFTDPNVLEIFKNRLWSRGYREWENLLGTKLRDSYVKASALVDICFRSLRDAGFGREQQSKTRSSIHDTTHAGYGIMADIFVTGDDRLLAMAKASFMVLMADCLPVSPEEFIALTVQAAQEQ